MYLELIAEILLAALAVFGLYAIIRLFVGKRLLPVRACMAVKIEAETEAEDIPFILNRVRDGMFFCSTRIVALVDPALAQNQQLLDALRAEGAELYFLKT